MTITSSFPKQSVTRTGWAFGCVQSRTRSRRAGGRAVQSSDRNHIPPVNQMTLAHRAASLSERPNASAAGVPPNHSRNFLPSMPFSRSRTTRQSGSFCQNTRCCQWRKTVYRTVGLMEQLPSGQYGWLSGNDHCDPTSAPMRIPSQRPISGR